MSATIPEGPPEIDDKQLRAELVDFYRLDARAVERIFELMQHSDLGFGDAAVHLQLLSRKDVEEAAKRVGARTQAAAPGLIENALRRVSTDRRVVVRHADPVKPGPPLGIAHEPDSARSERLRALRTELLLLNEGARGANCVTVMSADAGVGKSQLAAELAIAFAQLGRRTLLVDADLRNPQQHQLFASSNEHGLSRTIAEFEKPHYHPVTGLTHMHLLCAGPVPPNPLELLSDGRFEKLVTEWRNTYEFLVFDTPAVASFADGLAVATIVGRVLLLSRSNHSTYRTTRELMRRLAATQARVLGAVLNEF